MTVRIRPYTKKDRLYYAVSWREGTQLHRRTVSSMEKAEALEQEITEKLAQGQSTLTQRDTQEFHRLSKLLPAGVTLSDAVVYYMEHHCKTITIREAAVQFLQAQTQRGLTARSVGRDRLILEAFLNTYLPTTLLWKFTPNDLDTYLRTIPNPETRITHRQALVSLFNWARNKGYLPSDHLTAAERTDRPRRLVKDPQPLSADNLERILRHLEGHEDRWLCLPIALGAFAGLRSSEISREWERLEENQPLTGVLYMSSEKTKTRRRRPIPVSGALTAWTNPSFQLPSQECWVMWQQKVRKILRKAGIPWVRNGLRKGYVSHAVEYHGSIADVARFSGHSEETLKTYYMGLVTHADAVKWNTGILPL